jgi:dTDP-4-amino-4,6-dideoxygalactose transaminase
VTAHDHATHAPPRPYLGLSAPHIGEEEIEELLDSIRSGWLTTGPGPKVAAFQSALEKYLQTGHIRCLSSCTAGLTIALRVLGIGHGDEVLVPSMTFVSCANVVEHAGGVPVLVDSHPDSGLIDLDHAASLVTERTRAIMPVHLAGFPVDLDAVNAFRDRHGIAVVEDGAHAIGARSAPTGTSRRSRSTPPRTSPRSRAAPWSCRTMPTPSAPAASRSTG